MCFHMMIGQDAAAARLKLKKGKEKNMVEIGKGLGSRWYDRYILEVHPCVYD